MRLDPTDPLTLILRSLRLQSGLISRGRFHTPWAIRSGQSQGAIFHAVLEGSCTVQREGDSRGETIGVGELVVLTRGDAHVVSDGSGVRPAAISRLPRTVERGLPLVTYGGGGPRTRVLCGRFDFDHSAGPSLADLLPPVIVLRKQHARVVEWLETTLDLIAWELDHPQPGSEAVLARLTDILFIQVVRSYALSLKPGEGGWLGAVHDPQISRALALMHEQPEARWTAASLARQVGVSRSAFYARFKQLVGEPPSAYLTRWRIRCACDHLVHPERSIAEVASAVGYSSEDALARAFRRTMGHTPAAWRRQRLTHSHRPRQPEGNG